MQLQIKILLAILWVGICTGLMAQSEYVSIDFPKGEVWFVSDSVDYGVVKTNTYSRERAEGDSTPVTTVLIVDIYDPNISETGVERMVYDEKNAQNQECPDVLIETLDEDYKGDDQSVDWKITCDADDKTTYLRMIFTEKSAHFVYITYASLDLTKDDEKRLEKMMNSAKFSFE